MKEKTIKELQDEIQALNFLLLEKQDQINAIASERDKYKLIVESFFSEFEKQRQLHVRIAREPTSLPPQ